jgi:hypothetical protein
MASCSQSIFKHMTKRYEEQEDHIDGHLLTFKFGSIKKLCMTYADGDTSICLHRYKHQQYQHSIPMQLDHYIKLLLKKDEIDEALWQWEANGGTYRQHIGGNQYVTVDARSVTISDQLLMTELDLNPSEWIYLNVAYKRLLKVVPIIVHVRNCLENHVKCDGTLACQSM